MWICKLFGHRFIGTIWDRGPYAENYRISQLSKPICKRCGQTIRGKK